MVTGFIVLTLAFAIGSFVWAVLTKKGANPNVDAGDVSLMSAGIQDPTLAVSAFTVNKACQGCVGDCEGDLEDVTDTAVDLSTLNQPLADETSGEHPTFGEEETPVVRMFPQDIGTMIVDDRFLQTEPQPEEKRANPAGTGKKE
jgi:hypothetical protein